MFEERMVLYISPFYFKNGNTSKNKFFIILKSVEDKLIIGSLPTSKNKVPSLITKKHGCNNDNERMFNCYSFSPDKTITDNGFCFPKPTFIYGNDVEDYASEIIQEIYKVEGIDYEIKGRLTDDEYDAIIKCIKLSSAVRRGIKRLL